MIDQERIDELEAQLAQMAAENEELKQKTEFLQEVVRQLSLENALRRDEG